MISEKKLMQRYPKYSKGLMIAFVILLIPFVIMLPIFIIKKDWLYVFLCVVMIFSCIVHIRDIKEQRKQRINNIQ